MKTNSNFNFSLFTKGSLFFATIGLLTQCYEEPEYPEIPHIEFENLSLYEDEQGWDSLILEFKFQDGNGDLGLSTIDNVFPYNEFFLVLDSVGKDTYEPFTYSSTLNQNQVLGSVNLDNGGPSGLSAIALFPTNDDIEKRTTLPDFSCQDYKILLKVEDENIFFDPNTDTTGQGAKLDTFLIQQNPYFSNFHVEFYAEQGTEFVLLDDKSGLYIADDQGCFILPNERFPILNEESIIARSSLVGSIRVAIPHLNFRFVFKNNRIKIRFFIFDRNLNKSNIVETPVFELDQLIL